MARTDHRVGLALSGGGWRAAAFHLGVLQRLEELGLLADLDALSCVSGGAVVGALFALRRHQQGPSGYPVSRLIEEVRPVLQSNLRSEALLGSPWRAVKTMASFLRLGVSRTQLLADELDRRLYHGEPLSALPPWIVINATNLRTGKAWKFYRDAAGDFLTGATARTDTIRIADAVAASAAFPGLCDPLLLHLDWADLTAAHLDSARWQYGKRTDIGERSAWRKRYGRPAGAVAMPLVDGGLYDNDGFSGLRSWGISHAIFSGASPAEADLTSSSQLGEALRMVDVMHDRLGGGTRQLAYAVTFGLSPEAATKIAEEVMASLASLVSDASLPAVTRAECQRLRESLAALRFVNVPLRDNLFTGIAHALLHRTDLAGGTLKQTDDLPFEVPGPFRGLPIPLVEELSRVRTDLDALSPEIVDLLIAQGYFFVDAVVKQGMADVLPGAPARGDVYAESFAPRWPAASETVARARQNLAGSQLAIVTQQRRLFPVGRTRRRADSARYWANLAAGVLAALALLGGAIVIAVRLVESLFPVMSLP